MSSPEEIGAHSNKDSVDGLAEAPKAVSLKDVEDHEPVLATRDGECCDYRMGICKQSEKCGSKHRHVPYPSSSKWDTHHIQRLRFECYPFNVDPKNWSDDKVICEWVLRVFRHRIPDTFSECNDEKIDGDPDLPELPIALHTTHAESVASIIDRMSSQLSKELQEDSFLIMLKNFVSKYDLKNASIQKLCQAVFRGDFMPQGVTHYAHRNTLFAWVDALNMYSRGAFTESRLDELLASIINSAGNETDTLIRIKVRESTAKTINVCGQAVNVQSDIAVWSAHGDCVLQVITCIEHKVFPRPTDIRRVLPQIACEAVAVGKDTPFGNRHYKTVYQLSVHVVRSPSRTIMHVIVFLVRCHVSNDTLANMYKCPITNPLQRSYILYETVHHENLYSDSFISNVYKAIKAVLLIFKHSEVHD